MDELPLTAVGKIYKPALRALAALHVIEPMIAEVAGATLLDIKVIDHGAKGQIIEVHLHNAETLLSINEILGQFTIKSKVHIAI